MRNLLASALLALFLTCGGGGSTGGTGGGGNQIPPVPAPTALVVTPGSNSSEIVLAWSPAVGALDGYDLESKIGSDPFVKINANLIPKSTVSITLMFTSSAPDACVYAFRLRAVRGSYYSEYTNEASYTRGPNDPYPAETVYDFDRGGVVLSWTRNTTNSDGLRIERAECDAGGGHNGGWVDLPVPDPQKSTYFDASASSNKYFTYQLTNLWGARASQPSRQSRPVFTGVRPPQWIRADFDDSLGGVSIAWEQPGAQVDGIHLERSDCDPSWHPLGNWSVIPLPPGVQQTFLDRNIIEKNVYAYRVSFLHGSLVGPPTSIVGIASVPMLAPVNLQVQFTGPGFRISWQNRSHIATQIVVYRKPSSALLGQIATLPASANSYLDIPETLGYFTYQIEATGVDTNAYSSRVVGATSNPPGSLQLGKSALPVYSVNDAAWSPIGKWVFSREAPFRILSSSDPWPEYSQMFASGWGYPVVQVDTQGRPHAIFRTPRQGDNLDSDINHCWFNGAAWIVEPTGKKGIDSQDMTTKYRLDSNGNPHLVAATSSSALSYFHVSAGSWVEEPLAAFLPSGTTVSSFSIALDASDVPHVLVGSWTAAVDLVRTGLNTWKATTVPTGAIEAYPHGFLEGLWIDDSTGWVFFERPIHGSSGDIGTWVQQKQAGLWLNPVQIGWRYRDASASVAKVALSPDHSRLGVVLWTSSGVKVFHSTAVGWQETVVAPPDLIGTPLRIAFDTNQKIHLFINELTDYSDYHE